MMHQCPICQTQFINDKEAKSPMPFCSKRCQQVDLGHWLLQDYGIAGPSVEEEKIKEESEHDV